MDRLDDEAVAVHAAVAAAVEDLQRLVPDFGAIVKALGGPRASPHFGLVMRALRGQPADVRAWVAKSHGAKGAKPSP